MMMYQKIRYQITMYKAPNKNHILAKYKKNQLVI